MLNMEKDQSKISQKEYQRYSKQLILENIGLKGQKKLKKSKILIVGAGGLGCSAIIYLAISGIGCIGLIDEDKIEISNLNRQVLYNEHDIKKFKIDTAKERLKNLNNNCVIITHKYKLNRINSKEIICYYDIIIDATDNFKSRYIIDQTCYELNKTCIYGAVDKLNGQIAIFNYKSGIRYKNLYNTIELENNICNRYGVLGISTGYIGIIQAIETIKIILGLNKKCRNTLLLYNIVKNKTEQRKIYPNRNVIDNTLDNTNKSNFINLLENQRKHMKKTIIIDIRKENEFNKRHTNKSINIPIIQLKIHKTIHFLKNLSKNYKLIIYCNNTERSITASYILKNNNIYHYLNYNI
uniref:Molybdopterin biosynthesis protein n=1 Tax=Polysiphonia sp. TaxID=1967842 RepID=A0A1Z1MTK1_9FLOR|nr:Molybdopterin biosynthesis protein [Polysiphonia sp.]